MSRAARPEPAPPPEEEAARRAAILATMLRRELARRWPEKYADLAGEERESLESDP